MNQDAPGNEASQIAATDGDKSHRYPCRFRH